MAAAGAEPSVDGVVAGESPTALKRTHSLLAPIPAEQQLNLHFERICAWVSTDYEQPSVVTKLRRALAKEPQAPKQKKQILFDVSGELRPGEMLALMGPSGSGKTSLLSIISGRAPKAVTTAGRVTTGSEGRREKMSKADKRRVGFVLQDDLLFESLTVWETLDYAAALRLPRTMSAGERRARVEAVIAALGLSKCKDTIIGGFFRRGISGGERKRVSIGHELLINPAILMLDEPTSGLDSTTALHLLLTLKQLALGGRAVATTIHQPSSRLYQQLDRLMLLAEGHVVYYGAASQVTTWFTALGFALPYGVNVADFLLDLAQGEVEGGDFSRLASGSLDALGAAGGAQPKLLTGSSTRPRPDVNGTSPAARASSEANRQADESSRRRSLEAYSGSAGAAAAAAAVGSVLSGPAAVRALYSSYETFNRKHKEGFEHTQQLEDLRLALEPPLTKRQRAAAAAAAAAGKDPAAAAAAAAAAGGAARVPSRGSLIGRSLSKAGSFLGLDGLGSGGGAKAGLLSDEEDDDPELGRPISRAYSRSRSFGPAAAPGGGQPARSEGLIARGVRAFGLADRGGASYSMQWQVLLARSIKVKRFEALSSQRVWQAVAVAIITGLFWWQRGRGSSLLAASDVIGLLFFEMLFPAFTALFTALFLFPAEYRMLLKERASGMYRVSAYYAASSLSDLPMDCALPALFCVIIYFMGGLRLTAAAFWGNLLSLMLNVLTAQALGLLLGAIWMNPKTAQTVASILMLTFMLVGGYYVRGIPAWISWVRYLSFVYWGFNLLLKIEFAGATYYSCGGSGLGASEGPAAQPCTPVADLQAALQLPVDPNASPAVDVVVLAAMLIAFRAAVYWTLRHKTKQ